MKYFFRVLLTDRRDFLLQNKATMINLEILLGIAVLHLFMYYTQEKFNKQNK